MESIKVEGIKEAERVFAEMIRSYPKQTVAAGLRAAAKPFINNLKQTASSPEFRKLPGVKSYTKGKNPLIAVGMFGGRGKVVRRRNRHMSTFFIFYWLNYGTLSNRSAGHRFSNARKRKTEHYPHGTWKWKGGIKATNDTEKAWETSKSQVIASIPKELRKASDKYVKRMQSKIK
nr:MAG TPA: hypothetical protein [Caudoviricetes sp.]